VNHLIQFIKAVSIIQIFVKNNLIKLIKTNLNYSHICNESVAPVHTTDIINSKYYLIQFENKWSD